MAKRVMTPYGPGTRVEKTEGDYGFSGEILLAFEKRSGHVRWLVEDDRGLVLIWNARQITAAAVEPFLPQLRGTDDIDD